MSIQHENAAQIHKFAFVGTSDPGTVGAYKAWIDTNYTPARLKYRNAGNTTWLDLGPYDSDLTDIAALSPANDDVIQRKAGAWTNRTVAQLKADLALDNVPNIDATSRDNHTGSQLASTISNFNTAVDARVSQTALQDVVIVSASGDASVNGVYTVRKGDYNGKPYYNKEGQPSSTSLYAIVYYEQSPGTWRWYIFNSSGDAAYYSVGDADYPYHTTYLDAGYDPMLIGFPPAPDVRNGGLGAVRENYIPKTATTGAALLFPEGSNNGSQYVSINGPSSVTWGSGYAAWTLPVVAIETTDVVSSNVFVSNIGKQDLVSKTLFFHSNLGTNDTWNGLGLSDRNAGATITQFDIVYLGGSSTWLLADANGSGTYPARGIALNGALSGNKVKLFTQGVLRHDAWNWTVNGNIYLSTTAGGMTQTAPSTSGDKVQIIGWAITADIAYFDFNGSYTVVP